MKITACASPTTHPSVEPKPARAAVTDTAPGTCARSNCASRAHVDNQCTRALQAGHLSRAQSARFKQRSDERPAVQSYHLVEVGWLRSQTASRRSYELVFVVDCEKGLVQPFEADCRRGLHVHLRAAAQGPAQVP